MNAERDFDNMRNYEVESNHKKKVALAERFLVLNQNDLPADKIAFLRDRMLHCSLRKLTAMQNLSCRRVNNIQFISLILGWSGIDRMLIGDFGTGLLKLCTLGGFGLLMLWDWITIGGQTRKFNYLRVMGILDYDDFIAED